MQRITISLLEYANIQNYMYEKIAQLLKLIRTSILKFVETRVSLHFILISFDTYFFMISKKQDYTSILKEKIFKEKDNLILIKLC